MHLVNFIGAWGKELFESDDKKKSDGRSERVFLTPIVLVLFLQKVQEMVSEKYRRS